MRNEISDKKKPRYRREFLEMQYVAFFSQTIHLHNPKPGNSHGLEDQVLGKMFVRALLRSSQHQHFECLFHCSDAAVDAIWPRALLGY